MNKKVHLHVIMLFMIAALLCGQNEKVYSVKLYFGLSKPNGGAVSLTEWNTYQQKIASVFEGFNVVESVGFYKGKAERSKIVT